jgi:hypothetical protein
MLRQIVVEAETIGDSRTMFRLRIDANVIAEGLTAAQAHLLVGEILDRFTLPKHDDRASVRSAPSRWRGFGVNSGNPKPPLPGGGPRRAGGLAPCDVAALPLTGPDEAKGLAPRACLFPYREAE